MASDLSKLIQDSFTLTLNGLLAKDAKMVKITKAHPYDVEDTQFLLVQSIFNFSTFSSKISYLIPAKSASLIFNTMMGAPITDLADEIDDDAEDAIGEFISNTSGGFTTSVNGAELEDIGQTKFNISHKEILDGDQISDLETTFRFLIDLEDEELVIFVTFDDDILPFIPEILNSEITFHQERAPKIEEEEIIQEIEAKQHKIEEKVKEELPIQEEPIKEKVNDPKIKRLIMILGASLSFILLIFFILYFTGFFDPKPVIIKPKDLNVTKKVEEVSVIEYKTIKKVNFNSSEINKERLNEKLQDLTKYSVLTKEEIEQQKEEEKLRLLDIEREKQLIAFAKRNLEEPLLEKEKTILEESTTETLPVQDEVPTTIKEEPLAEKIEQPVEKKVTENLELNYVQTSSIKYRLFKSVVQETETTQARISICNNKEGKTTIYIGPFENETLQNNMINLTKKEDPSIDISLINITEEEFNMRCNLE